ncbi:MAG: hypothetical protein QHG99_07525 [Methanomicrobiales archaeon]|nr:hypothetical protein [Methanomicrobiales archaeon]
MKGRTKKRLEQGVGDISAIMESYDHFRSVREGFMETANWMLLISVGTFTIVMIYSIHFLVGMVSGPTRLAVLSIIFLGVSASVFSILRGILYYIQSSVERSMRTMNAVKEVAILPGDHPTRSAARVLAMVETAVHQWWNARTLTTRFVLMLIPGVLFFLLGLASLLAFVLAFLLL